MGKTPYTMGSLFDGSGGFPLAAILCGIVPKWAAEIEPYPIAVTKSRFPDMHHLGDISKVDGAEIEPVDIITFGSPCQDLSVAGKRAGLKHEANGDEETTRSGLFMEAVRIIKEMRKATGGKYPRFALWENVPGAFSSQKGEDFRVVLEELIRIIEPGAIMPPVPKGGWAYADSYTGDGWSLAYRVFDAQYWGVPQRRRRIHLILDLGGQCAREILFEREGVRGYFAEGRTPRQGIAAHPQSRTSPDDREGENNCLTPWDSQSKRVFAADGVFQTLYSGERSGQQNPAVLVPYTLEIRSGCEGGGKGALVHTDMRSTLATNNDQYLFQPIPGILLDDQGGQQINIRTDEKTPTIRAEMHGNIPAVVCKTFDARGNGDGKTVSTITGDHESRITDYTSVVCMGNGQLNQITMAEQSKTLDCMHDKQAVVIASGVEARNATEYPEMAGALQADACHNLNSNNVVRIRYIVRRLTPTECARLQGFADRWGDLEEKADFADAEFRFWLKVRNVHAAINGKPVKTYTKAQMLTWYNKLHTDSAEYKMWGNGIALPPALYCMQGIADALCA